LHTLTAHWDGNQWNVVPSPNFGSESNYLTSATMLASDNVWAVGYVHSSGSQATLIEHWDGVQWQIVPSPNPGAGSNFLYGVTASSGNDIWAVGNYGDPGIPQTLILHWDGSSWAFSPSPNHSPGANYLYGVAVVAPNEVFAVGTWVNTSPYQTFIERYSGGSCGSVTATPSPTVTPTPTCMPGWDRVISPNPGVGGAELNGVAAVGPNDVWAVGYYVNNDTVKQTLIERWNGVTWNVIPSPNMGSDDNVLFAVDVWAANDAWAVGYFGVQPLALHWNGSQWSSIPSPGTGSLRAVTVVGPNDVWAVGALILHWDGVFGRWCPVPPFS
jgi:hypothetical protein